MEFIRGIYNLPSPPLPCVATIGNFDGVHLGHQAILRQTKIIATEMGLGHAVLLFEPQPQEYFMKQSAPPRLKSLREKLQLFQQQGIDRVVCLRFDQAFSSLSPEAFVKQVLIDGMSIKALIVGEDFRFGHQRQGGLEDLQEYGQVYGFKLYPAVTTVYRNRRISSTWIRSALTDGDFALVKQLLGRDYQMSGRVIHGDKRGRQLGFPTANLALNRLQSPVKGVFATIVDGLDDKVYHAVTNIGTRPVFGGERMLVETHILDFDGNIYGRRVTIKLLKLLRKEQNFTSVDELKKQIDTDVRNAREFFAEIKN